MNSTLDCYIIFEYFTVQYFYSWIYSRKFIHSVVFYIDLILFCPHFFFFFLCIYIRHIFQSTNGAFNSEQKNKKDSYY